MKQETKHIAFIVKYFPTVSETFIVNQINGLIDAGFQVTLFAYNQVEQVVIHDSLKRYGLLDKVKYFIKPPVSKWSRLHMFLKWTFKHYKTIHWPTYFKALNVFKHGKAAYTLKLFFEAQWFLKPYGFDVIHAHFGMNGERMAYLKACGILEPSLPLLTTFHGYDLEPCQLQSYKITYANLFKRADAFTVNTPYLEYLLNQINVNKKPCYILPVGLDTNFFKRQNSKKETQTFDVVFCGKLISLKGPDTAIIIVKRLHEKGYTQVRLHIIGDGILRSALAQQVKDLALPTVVCFYGQLSQADIIKQFEQADVFLLPGRYDANGRAETQGLVIQEAQAMALPVVVSDVGGMKYGLLSNESGFVIAEGDVDGFVNAIEQLIVNPDLKFKMGKVGKRLVEKEYCNNRLIKSLVSIYSSID